MKSEKKTKQTEQSSSETEKSSRIPEGKEGGLRGVKREKLPSLCSHLLQDKNAHYLREKICNYFEERVLEGKRFTVPSLALYLGFNHREGLTKFEDENNPKVTDAIKKAILRIEIQRNEDLISGRGNVAGTIFDLKNNFGYKDAFDTRFSGSLDLNVTKKALSQVVKKLRAAHPSRLSVIPESPITGQTAGLN